MAVLEEVDVFGRELIPHSLRWLLRLDPPGRLSFGHLLASPRPPSFAHNSERAADMAQSAARAG